ncbi:MAG: BamA/TamA family outer membrane protein [Vicinamibacteria bacterium]|nr:BamA/TamA family outer membrane protein [Vicinamibacteria bacterium]
MDRTLALLSSALIALAPAARADEPASREVVASTEYQAGSFRRYFLGDDYRVLWATPVRVEVLDLGREAGGLTPVRRVGGQQTKGLALKGADGLSYTFRGLEKDPSTLLGGEFEDLRGTPVEDLLRDQMGAQHPGSELVAGALGRAAGLLVPQWRLVVLPDSPVLGEFRADFAGAVGTFAVYPTTGFGGSLEVIDHFEMAKRLQAGDGRPDPRAWLRARLLDLTMGDWDRHRKQWRWARLEGREHFQPIPEDRDQAFSRYEGALLDMARRTDPRPQAYGPDFPSPLGITFNSRDQDRRLLAGFTREQFEAEAHDLAAALTDEVVTAAVAQLPEEWQAVDGARLEAALRARRDGLAQAAREYHAFLAKRVDVYLTDRAERAVARFAADGSLTVEAGAEGAATPFVSRRFDPRETEEVRVYLLAGDDAFVVEGRGPIHLRVIGGLGHDRLDDAAGGGTRFYDDGAATVVAGPGTRHITRPYTVPPGPKAAPWIPPRDWGRRTTSAPWLSYGGDLGVFLGYGFDTRTFDFRKDPWGTHHVARAGWSFGSDAPRVEYRAERRKEGTDTLFRLDARVSGVDKVRSYGYGNETEQAIEDDDVYKTSSDELMLSPTISFATGARSAFSVGPVFEYSDTTLDEAALAGALPPYGAGSFAAAGVHAGWRFDGRDRVTYPTRGAVLALRGAAYPAILDVETAYGFAEGEASGYATAGPFTFAGRVGGRQTFGDYPLTAAAYLGGTGLEVLGGDSPRTTVRGYHSRRYAGDASLFANAEVRVPVVRFTLLLPMQWGVFGFVDTGRVWYEDEDSKKWHTGQGVGLFVSLLRHFATFSVSMGWGEEETKISVNSGFAF